MKSAAIEKTEKELLQNIVNILTKMLHPKYIYLFGSRASGNSKQNSDFDIAIKGSTATFRDKRLAKEKLDKKLGIYSFDLIELEKISSDFSALIIKQGKLIYKNEYCP